MGRWLAIGAVFGFGVAVLLISVIGGPGDQPAAPVPAVDAGVPVTVLKAIETPMPLPSAAARHLGALGPPLALEGAGPPKPGRALEPVGTAPDAGPAKK